MLLILSTSILPTVACADYEKQANNKILVISVSGGMGIHIEVEGVTDETSIAITLEDANIRFINKNEFLDSIDIYVAIIDFGGILFGSFVLHISVGNDVYSYQCRSFLLIFAYDFTPLE
jgi:hypothetical protein